MTKSPQKITTVEPFWQVPWVFAVHAIVGTSIFAIVAATAVLLEFAIDQLEAHHVGIVIITVLKALGYLVFFIDVGLYTVFLWRTAKRAIKKL